MLGALTISQATLDTIIDDAGRRHGVEPALIRAIIKNESNWDVNASRYEKHIEDSSWGLMQVLLKTAKWILKNDALTITQLVSPKTNIEAGTTYLAWLQTRYGKGNIKDVIAAYNAGSPRKTSDGSYVNQRYVDKVYNTYLLNKTVETVATPVGASVAALIGVAALAYALT